MRIAADMTSLSDNFSGLERYAFCMVSEMIGLGRDRWYLVVKNDVPESIKQLKKRYPDRICLVHVSGGKLLVNQIKLPLVMSRIKADAYLFPAFPVPLLFGKALGCQRTCRRRSCRTCAEQNYRVCVRKNSCVCGKPNCIARGRKKIYALIADTAVKDVSETMKLRSRLLFGLGYRHSVRVCESVITISHFSEKRIRKHYKNVRNIIYAPCGVSASGDNCYSTDRTAKTLPVGTAGSATNGGHEFFYDTSENFWNEIKKKYGLPENYILVLSTLEPRKNISQVFNAYFDLVSKSTDIPKLVVAGRKGWMVDKELESVKENYSDCICLTGFIDENDLKVVYSHADIFVDASIYEGFGMPPVEALSNGVNHVLVSDIPAHREVLGKDAVYFRLYDVNDLAMKMAQLCKDGTGRKAEPKCLSRYSWRKSAETVYVAIHV